MSSNLPTDKATNNSLANSDMQAFAIDWFRRAVPYLQAHRGRVFVVCFEGETIAKDSFDLLVQDIRLLAALGVKLVLVHGSRMQTDAKLESLGHRLKFHLANRITDEQALQIAKQVCGELKSTILAKLSTNIRLTQVKSTALHVVSGNFVYAKALGVIDGVNHQFTGKILKVDAAAIMAQLNAGNLLLLSPLGYAATGELFNLLSEDVAVAVAAALNADKLIFLSEAQLGAKLGKQINAQQAQQLALTYQPDDCRRKYLQSAAQACTENVARVHIISRCQPDSLLEELFTRDGTGTLITEQNYQSIRAAKEEDVAAIKQLLKPFEQASVLVMRNKQKLLAELDDFAVLQLDGKIIACVALHFYHQEQMAELACLVVAPEYADSGYGAAMLEHAIDSAKAQNIKQLFVLSTQTGQWFHTHGFMQTDIAQLPFKKRANYNAKRGSMVFMRQL